MKLPFTKAKDVDQPIEGCGFAFIDSDDKKLKIKKHDSVIEFTNDLSDIQLLDLSDYTAFEVYPNSKDLLPGEYSRDGFTNLTTITKMTSHTLTIRSDHLPEEQNVIIDWGDGTYDKLSDFPVENITGTSDRRYRFVHEYKITDVYYIVKIYGNTYFSIMPDNDVYYSSYNSIISRVFDADLPIASHITNLSSFCKGANRLLHVDLSYCKSKYNFRNISNMFCGCKNMIECVGWSTLDLLANVANLFYKCTELTNTDFKIPRILLQNTGCTRIFEDTPNLSINVRNVFPYADLIMPKLSANSLFKNSGITISSIDELSKILWNNKNTTWIDTATCFSGCSDDIRALVPETWGGTASDDIIEKSLEEKYNDLLARVEAIENA